MCYGRYFLNPCNFNHINEYSNTVSCDMEDITVHETTTDVALWYAGKYTVKSITAALYLIVNI